MKNSYQALPSVGSGLKHCTQGSLPSSDQHLGCFWAWRIIWLLPPLPCLFLLAKRAELPQVLHQLFNLEPPPAPTCATLSCVISFPHRVWHPTSPARLTVHLSASNMISAVTFQAFSATLPAQKSCSRPHLPSLYPTYFYLMALEVFGEED